MADSKDKLSKPVRRFRALTALSFGAHTDAEWQNRTLPAGYEGELPLSDTDIQTLIRVGAIEEMN